MRGKVKFFYVIVSGSEKGRRRQTKILKIKRKDDTIISMEQHTKRILSWPRRL